MCSVGCALGLEERLPSMLIRNSTVQIKDVNRGTTLTICGLNNMYALAL